MIANATGCSSIYGRKPADDAVYHSVRWSRPVVVVTACLRTTPSSRWVCDSRVNQVPAELALEPAGKGRRLSGCVDNWPWPLRCVPVTLADDPEQSTIEEHAGQALSRSRISAAKGDCARLQATADRGRLPRSQERLGPRW